MSTTPEHAPRPAPDHLSPQPGMPFHWAMAFAFLVFVAMCVAFWCGHSFSIKAVDTSISMQQSPAAPSRR